MQVTSSFTLASKLIVFVNIDMSTAEKSNLQVILQQEANKYKRGFESIVIIGENNSSVEQYAV